MNFFLKLFVTLFSISFSIISAEELRRQSFELNSKQLHELHQKIMSSSNDKTDLKMSSSHFQLQSANSFPANPTYAVVEYYNSNNCGSGYYSGFSYLLDTCISSKSTSVMYTCGK